ncbi:MAG: G5 domain-containing protein [Anaerolineae bacterium]
MTIVADGRERVFVIPAPITVADFLNDAKVDVQLGDLDQVNPPLFTQISDGLRITVARIAENDECEQSDIPYQQTSVLNEGLNPGEQRIVQAGQNGVEEICFRVTVVDGVPKDRVEIKRTEIRAAQNEVIYVGPTGEIEPIPIKGTIAYLSNGNAWVVQGSSTSKRPITTEGDLDKHVFALSADGQQLLFTRKPSPIDIQNSFNQLWLILDISKPNTLISLDLDNVLYADWIPGRNNTLSYSSAEKSGASPGWSAFNDLWELRVDPKTGDSLSVKQIIKKSGGLYSWWGTRFQWSPDGNYLAWAQADRVGVINMSSSENGEAISVYDNYLLNYAVLKPVSDWSWRATISWSPDSKLLATTVHGVPVGTEGPESSPAFDATVVAVDGSFSMHVVQNSGIWSNPQFSPFISQSSNEFPLGYIAYLEARDQFNTINGKYDLFVADRDGSNARIIFPGEGITAGQSVFHDQEFAWSPDGSQIALIYKGNLWVVDVESLVAHKLTLDGQASSPVWSR